VRDLDMQVDEAAEAPYRERCVMTRKGKKANNGTPDKRNEPKANRLMVPGYEPSAKNAEVLPWKWAADRLKTSRQYWIATTRPNGSPHLMVI
jgi:hypothetical protein